MLEWKEFGNQIERLKKVFNPSYFNKTRVEILYKKIGDRVTDIELPHLVDTIIAYCRQTPNVDDFMKCLLRMREENKKDSYKKTEKRQDMLIKSFLNCGGCSIRFEFTGTAVEIGMLQKCDECKENNK